MCGSHAQGETSARTSRVRFEKRMIHKKKKEDEVEDKKVVVPPGNRNLCPAADTANIRHHA